MVEYYVCDQSCVCICDGKCIESSNLPMYEYQLRLNNNCRWMFKECIDKLHWNVHWRGLHLFMAQFYWNQYQYCRKFGICKSNIQRMKRMGKVIDGGQRDEILHELYKEVKLQTHIESVVKDVIAYHRRVNM